MARVHPPHFWEKWMRRFVRSEMMMKAVWKKLIAVAFCGATAASMLSVGASAYFPYDNTIEYGQDAAQARYYLDETKYTTPYDYAKITMKSEPYVGGNIVVSVSNAPSNSVIKYDWSRSTQNIATEGTNADQTQNSAKFNGPGKYTAICDVTITYTYKNKYGKEVTKTISDSVQTSGYVLNKDAYDALGKPDYGSNLPHWNDYHDWDDWYNDWKDQVDDWWWGNDGYYVVINGHKYWVDGDWGYNRPSYSKEYEVDWSDDTFYYNGKVQMPTATVTIGGRTIELDVKLISGDGESVGRHRVRASLPSRYSRYDITGTTLYYEIEEPEKDGFVTENGNTYYYDNGRKVTGWQTINGSRYYFLDNGEAADGWVKDGPADWYYFSDGKMQTGWINDNGTTYYCYGTGKMCHGRWHEIAGKWYYFNESGAMLTSQWILDKGNWYYVAGDGVMATNTTVPGGYRVNASGVWVK